MRLDYSYELDQRSIGLGNSHPGIGWENRPALVIAPVIRKAERVMDDRSGVNLRLPR